MTNLLLEEKYAIVTILSLIMKADGIIHPKEEVFMDNTYYEFGIKIKDIEEISNINELQAKEIIKSMAKDKQMYAYNLFVSMAECDGFVDPRETAIIKRLFE